MIHQATCLSMHPQNNHQTGGVSNQQSFMEMLHNGSPPHVRSHSPGIQVSNTGHITGNVNSQPTTSYASRTVTAPECHPQEGNAQTTGQHAS